jgi:hypothetical protein
VFDPEHCACLQHNASACCYAAGKGKVDVVDWLCGVGGCDPNEADGYSSPIQWALEGGQDVDASADHFTVVKLLVEKYGVLSSPDAEGLRYRYLGAALQGGNRDILHYIVEKCGANISEVLVRGVCEPCIREGVHIMSVRTLSDSGSMMR